VQRLARNGEWKGSKLVRASKRRVDGEEFQRANVQSLPWQTNLLVRRAKAAKSPQSLRGRNPLVKEPLLAMASVSTREAS